MPTDPGGGERLPPQSREAERCVLGSMLRDNAVIGDVLQIIREENFYADAHQNLAREELPQRGHLADADRAGTEQRNASAQDRTLAKPVDGPADPGQQTGAEQKAERGRGAQGPGRPAMNALQFLDVDGVSVGAESPRKHRDGEIRDDCGPAAP